MNRLSRLVALFAVVLTAASAAPRVAAADPPPAPIVEHGKVHARVVLILIKDGYLTFEINAGSSQGITWGDGTEIFLDDARLGSGAHDGVVVLVEERRSMVRVLDARKTAKDLGSPRVIRAVVHLEGPAPRGMKRSRIVLVQMLDGKPTIELAGGAKQGVVKGDKGFVLKTGSDDRLTSAAYDFEVFDVQENTCRAVLNGITFAEIGSNLRVLIRER